MKTQLCWVALLLLLLLLLLVGKTPTSATIHTAQPGVLAATSYNLTMARQQIMMAQFECYLKIINDPPNLSEDPFCNRTWDGWLCWEDSFPGTAVQHCPNYFLDFDPCEKATKVCGMDGRWFHHPESNRIWSNYTQCSIYMKDNIEEAFRLYYLAIVGQGLSVVSLLISLWIFFYFKSLSCQRISLHKNMFLSFVLNSVCTVINLLVVTNNRPLIASNPMGCKVLTFLSSYALCSNYFWMLCEGIYLHTLIIVAVFAEGQQLCWYFILGWVFPLVPATIYSVARWIFYNDSCWISSQTHLLYIVHAPIYTALLVNMFFLLNIVRVLITKLRVTHCTQSSTYMKAVRATLILVPLLGVQFILVPWIPEERQPRFVCQVLLHIFTHYQGLLVAAIFCFCNAEVQTVLKRQWAQISVQCIGRLVTVRSRSHSYSSSFTEMSRVATSRSMAPPNLEPQKEAPPYSPVFSATNCWPPEAGHAAL